MKHPSGLNLFLVPSLIPVGKRNRQETIVKRQDSAPLLIIGPNVSEQFAVKVILIKIVEALQCYGLVIKQSGHKVHLLQCPYFRPVGHSDVFFVPQFRTIGSSQIDHQNIFVPQITGGIKLDPAEQISTSLVLLNLVKTAFKLTILSFEIQLTGDMPELPYTQGMLGTGHSPGRAQKKKKDEYASAKSHGLCRLLLKNIFILSTVGMMTI
jgi:hypothetical protein